MHETTHLDQFDSNLDDANCAPAALARSLARTRRTAPHRTAPYRTAPHRTAPHRTTIGACTAIASAARGAPRARTHRAPPTTSPGAYAHMRTTTCSAFPPVANRPARPRVPSTRLPTHPLAHTHARARTRTRMHACMHASRHAHKLTSTDPSRRAHQQPARTSRAGVRTQILTAQLSARARESRRRVRGFPLAE